LNRPSTVAKPARMCSCVPVGALATLTGTQLHILAGFATVDGRFSAIEEASGPPTDHQALAEDLAARLVARRAELPNAPRVLITRPRGASRRLAGRLVEHGLAPLVVPAIEIEPLDVATELATAIDAQPVGGWAVVTSANGAAAVASAAAAGAELQRPRWAAVGRATARALREAGAPAAWLPSQHNAAALADELPIEDGTAVLLVRGDLAEATLPHRLAARGATLSEVVAYRTVEAPASSRALLEAVLAGREPAAVVFSSPSAVRGALALADERWRAQLLALPAICSGPTTAAAARAAGFGNIVEAAAPDADALAELVAQTIALAAGRAR
ncbi:MAG TPA: uroporphyrinogen-III synthase, partial [Candidatus Limnocylindria bacterium]|nr:uroporphyrinogen-III synthase [Candidatus Limnocylindria bacterium]